MPRSPRGGGHRHAGSATRATEDELYLDASRRALHLLRDGVTTLEVKSGYWPDRRKMRGRWAARCR